MANQPTTVTDLLSVSLLVEQDPSIAAQVPLFVLQTDERIRRVVLEAITSALSDRLDVRVEWVSSECTPLDNKQAVGRCAVCNCWVYDFYNADDWTPTRISRGAVIEGRYRCDEHLPTGHPLCFAGVGYDDPIPEPNTDQSSAN